VKETAVDKLTINDLDCKNKRVLVRVDFNVPLDKSGNITDDTRIQASVPTVEKLLQQNAKVILVSHLGRPKGKSPEFSLQPCASRLSKLLKKPVTMAKDCIGPEVESLVKDMKPGDVLLLENVRFYEAEEKPEKDPTFAENLSKLADIYINDAFGTAHRAHSSTTMIAKYFPGKAASGLLLEKEIAFLGDIVKNPKHPFYAVIGGAKVSTKIGVLKTLVSKVDALFLGGAMSYTFLKAKGISAGDSVTEDSMLETAKEIMQECQKKNVPLYLPLDIIAAKSFDNSAEAQVFSIESGISQGYQGMDIGPKTIASWCQQLNQAKTILWNGPVGVFEFSNFSKGTNELAKYIASRKDAITIVGGGDSVAAIQEAGVSSDITHISTGGGASLEYLEFGTLPGIEALSQNR
jgi:phosphoglycerate kinase